MNAINKPELNLKKILEIIHTLRSPEGCIWDRQQKTEDVARYLKDEAYELLDAIDQGSPEALREEMGDLLFQILFLADISEEAGHFNLADVIEDVTDKMIRRHPHVFGNIKVADIDEIRLNWDNIKKHVEHKNSNDIFAGIPLSMPALLRAQKITAKAAKVGFDWNKTDDVFAKIEEELFELKAALPSGKHEKIQEEMGDLLLSLTNLCRFIDVDAEDALIGATRKFNDRFRYIEEHLRMRGKTPLESSIDEMDDLWNESKKIERL